MISVSMQVSNNNYNIVNITLKFLTSISVLLSSAVVSIYTDI